MLTTEIAYEVRDHIATITLDRPDKLNAFTNVMMHELVGAFEEVDADGDVRAVVVTGRGRGFCSGFDLSAGAETFAGGASDVLSPTGQSRDGGGIVALRIYRCLKPVIAAVNGPAAGVGATVTLPMDIRLASETARFGFVFTRRGLVPEACSSWFLPRAVGMQQAAEWVFTGRVFDATEARSAGLVRSVHPPDQLLPAAYALATEIASNAAPVSVALSRQLMWRMLGASHPMAAHRAESRGIEQRGASDDAREGVVSFLEKRSPEFSMCIDGALPDLFPGWTEPDFA